MKDNQLKIYWLKWCKWYNHQLEITEILKKITEDMYNRDAWDPIWRKELNFNSIVKFKNSLYQVMWKTDYNPRYIGSDYQEYFSCPREYKRWTNLEKNIIGRIFGIWMPYDNDNNKDDINEFLDKLGGGKLRILLNNRENL